MTSPTSPLSPPASLSESEQFYASLIQERGADAASGFSAQGQRARFDQILACLPRQPQAARLLDYGCGAGDFFPALRLKRHYWSYMGVDREPQFISAAKQRFPLEPFNVADFNDDAAFGAWGCLKPFDAVVASGVFCWANDEAWHGKVLERLWALTEGTLVFNVLSVYGPSPQRPGHELYGLTLAEVVVGRLKPTRFEVHQGYHGCDMTIALRR